MKEKEGKKIKELRKKYKLIYKETHIDEVGHKTTYYVFRHKRSEEIINEIMNIRPFGEDN